jgi:NAD(P)-dependent dehydrogenase (short-subunit alcohol dehydrogenase family)
MPGICLITGGARGIGAATARLVAQDGLAVAIGYRERADAAEALAREIEAAGGRAAPVKGDVAKEADIVAMFDATEAALGPVTHLVNSAGISVNAKVRDFDAAAIAHLMQVNVIGLMLCCREAVRRMPAQLPEGGGSIVNVSSMAATIGGRAGASAYAASKAAVDAFTTGFAKEVAKQNIRVNAVRPGMTRTDMTADRLNDPAIEAQLSATIAMHRVGEAQEIAEAIRWLLSPAASFISGAHLNASGGGFIIGERQD